MCVYRCALLCGCAPLMKTHLKAQKILVGMATNNPSLEFLGFLTKISFSFQATEEIFVNVITENA